MITGIDISHWQGRPDLARLQRDHRVDACYIKYSEYRRDPEVGHTLQALREYLPDAAHVPIDGLSVGLYDLWHAELGLQQSDDLVVAYEQLSDRLAEPPAIDLETCNLREAGARVKLLPALVCRLLLALEVPRLRLYLSARGARLLEYAGIWPDLWQPGVELWFCGPRSTYPHLDTVALPPPAPPWSWWQWTHVDGFAWGVESESLDLNAVRPRH